MSVLPDWDFSLDAAHGVVSPSLYGHNFLREEEIAQVHRPRGPNCGF